MRVRTGRFANRKHTCRSYVCVSLHPKITHTDQALVLQPLVGHSDLGRQRLRHPPVALAADGGQNRMAFTHAERKQMPHLPGYAGHQDVVLNVVEKLRQIQIDGNAVTRRDIGFPCTTAAFTLPNRSDGLCPEVPTRPQTGPSTRFLPSRGIEMFVGSHFCAWISFRQHLAVLPLPSASSYPCRMRQVRHSCRGLSPHQLMPMSGAHPAVNRTLRDKAAQRRLLLRCAAVGRRRLLRGAQQRMMGYGQDIPAQGAAEVL